MAVLGKYEVINVCTNVQDVAVTLAINVVSFLASFYSDTHAGGHPPRQPKERLIVNVHSELRNHQKPAQSSTHLIRIYPGPLFAFFV